MNICFVISDVDWALTKDVFGLIGSVVSLVGLIAAIYFGAVGLSTWKKQLRGGSDHKIAMEALVGLYKFRDSVVAAREQVFLLGYLDEPDESMQPNQRLAKFQVFSDAMKTRYELVLSDKIQLETAALACEAAWGDTVKAPLHELQRLHDALHGGSLKLVILKNPFMDNVAKEYYVGLRSGDERIVFDSEEEASLQFSKDFEYALTELEYVLKSKLSK